MIQNFRPGVIERIGLGYEGIRELNPHIVYGEITGYGNTGTRRTKPGQDLLVQSLSGLPWLNGDAAQPPVPFGLAALSASTATSSPAPLERHASANTTPN